jgi:hypothetical protein
MASSQCHSLEWPQDTGPFSAQQMLTDNMSVIFTPQVAESFVQSNMHQDWLLACQHCLASLVYLGALKRDAPGTHRPFPLPWIYSRHKELKRALDAYVQTQNAEAWRQKFDAKDVLHQILTMLIESDTRRSILDLEATLEPLFSINVKEELGSEWLQRTSTIITKPGVVQVLACHMEGLRSLSHMLLLATRAPVMHSVDQGLVKQTFGSFLATVASLVKWLDWTHRVEASSTDIRLSDIRLTDTRLLPILPMSSPSA